VCSPWLLASTAEGDSLTAARPSLSGHASGGLLMVPPLTIVRFDVSWQLAGMSRWARFVLS
jgi:hypothetical protein